MKKLTAILLCLLLTGCQTANPDASQQASSSVQPQQQKQSDEKQPEPQSEDLPTPETPTDAPTWASYLFTTGPFSMELPENWEEDKEMGGHTTIFFTDKSRAIDTQPSNVVIEISPNNINKKQPQIDYTDPKIQQEFIDFLKDNAEQRMGELQNPEVRIWQQPMTFILGYDRQAENGTLVRQTCYYPMQPEYHSMVVYATDFKDEITPPLEEVVLHILSTWHSDWADGGTE